MQALRLPIDNAQRTEKQWLNRMRTHLADIGIVLGDEVNLTVLRRKLFADIRRHGLDPARQTALNDYIRYSMAVHFSLGMVEANEHINRFFLAELTDKPIVRKPRRKRAAVADGQGRPARKPGRARKTAVTEEKT